MQKIKIFPAPHVEVRIHVSDGMAADLKECWEMSARLGAGKDCSTCSWCDVEIEGTGMCELEEVRKKILGGERWGD